MNELEKTSMSYAVELGEGMRKIISQFRYYSIFDVDSYSHYPMSTKLMNTLMNN